MTTPTIHTLIRRYDRHSTVNTVITACGLTMQQFDAKTPNRRGYIHWDECANRKLNCDACIFINLRNKTKVN